MGIRRPLHKIPNDWDEGDIHRVSEEEVREQFIKWRYQANGGKPVCAYCQCDAVYTYKSQLQHPEARSPQPDFDKVEAKAGLFARVAAKIKIWIGKSLGKAIIAGLAAEYTKILDYLHAAYKAIMDWLPPHLPF